MTWAARSAPTPTSRRIRIPGGAWLATVRPAPSRRPAPSAPPRGDAARPQPDRLPAPLPDDDRPLKREQSPGVTADGPVEYVDVEDFLGTLKKVNDKITSTLDPDILKSNPARPPDKPLYFIPVQDYATGLTKEVLRQVNDVQDTLVKIPAGWFGVGGKQDVPKDACFVGHYRGCRGDCYVWVCPAGRPGLAEFTLNVLKLSTAVKETQVFTVPSGIQFSPLLTNPR